jgi:hypothetical protein
MLSTRQLTLWVFLCSEILVSIGSSPHTSPNNFALPLPPNLANDLADWSQSIERTARAWSWVGSLDNAAKSVEKSMKQALGRLLLSRRSCSDKRPGYEEAITDAELIEARRQLSGFLTGETPLPPAMKRVGGGQLSNEGGEDPTPHNPPYSTPPCSFAIKRRLQYLAVAF